MKLKFILEAISALKAMDGFVYSQDTQIVAKNLNECARVAHVLERELADIEVPHE